MKNWRLVLKVNGQNCYMLREYAYYWQARLWCILHGYIFGARHCLFLTEEVNIVEVSV